MTASIEGIVYPPGVRDLSEDISTDDLVRRLKECAQAFQSMAQDEENALRFEPLAHLLVSERFLDHKSQDVRLLVACCIADIFRVSAPDAPYKDECQIKMVLEFFIDQLKGLSNPNNPAFKRYFYLLENLSVVKTFNICFDLQNSQKIVCDLFKLMFKIINDHQFLKLQRIIVDLLSPLINEADLVPAELINIIFNHIIEPKKTQNKNACILAQEILRKTASSIGTYVQAYFTNQFYLGKPNVSERLCDLIYELHSINHGMMAFVIPQLEGKLKSSDEKERLMVTKLVARMFSDKKSNMIEENKSLWTSFLARFNDISSKVRLLCIKYISNFLLHHPESKDEITEVICHRHLDTDEEVRYCLVSTVVGAAKDDITSINGRILECIKERGLDKKFRIRKECILGLAKIYKQCVLDPEYVDPAIEEMLSFVKNKVLYLYYQTCEDKFLVERILHTCLIPYQSHMEKRMKLLYQLYCTIDYDARKAFKEILRNQKHMRSLTNGLLEIIQQKRVEKTKLLEAKIKTIAKILIEPRKSAEHISKFCKDLENNIRLRSIMSLLLNGNISCSEAEKKVKEVLKILGDPTSPYYTTIKLLLERIVPVLLDKESIKYLVSIAKNSIVDDGVIEDELKLVNSGPKGMGLINALANSYPHYFFDEELFSNLVEILESRQDDLEISEITLDTLNFISKDLENIYPNIYRKLLPILQKFIKSGTPKQAKYAVYTVHKMVNDKETVFGEIIESLRDHFTMTSQYFRTALVSIGHIAYLCHDMFASQFKFIVAQTVVRDMLMKDHDLPRGGEELWGPFESLPEETKIKIEGMKVMVRWLAGLKDMVQPAASTFKLLNAVLENKGDLIQKNVPGPKENSWMRLSAASCFLKLCREPNYTECLAIEFFLNLAYVMNDPCLEVRKHFAAKVHKGLIFMKLPMEFIAILAVGGLDTEKDFNKKVTRYVAQNISKRREYVREKSISSDELPHQWPDYSLPIVVYLLAHAPFFKVYNDLDSLYKIKGCLQTFIDALILKNENYSFAFFKRLLENIKQTKDKLEPDNESRNLKLYAVCDLALNILMSKPNFVLKDFPGQPKLNSKFFTEPDKSYSNMVTYLPPQLLNTSNLAKSGFDVEVFDKIKEKNASKNIPKPSTSQEESLPSSSHEENIPSTTDLDPIPSTTKAPILSKTKVTISTDSNSSISQSESETNNPKHSGDAFPISIGTIKSETSNHSGTNSQIPGTSDVASESHKQSENNNSSSSVINLNNGDISHSDSISYQTDTEMDKIISSIENSKTNCKSKNLSLLKKKCLPRQAVVNRKSTRSSFKDDASSSLCSEYSKQNGELPSSPSANSVDSHCPSDYENVIKPCSVVLKRLVDSPPETLNGYQNGSVSFKRKHNSMDSEDYSSNQGSSASTHLSEESPRKRGRPPKKNSKTNQELSTLPTNKRRKFASTSTNSVQSSRSSSRTAVNSSLKSTPTKSVVKNGKLPKEKKSPVKSKVNNNHSSNSKKINSNALREELTAEINEIYNVRKTSTKTVKSKQANGQQNKKTDGRTTGRRR